jgi:5-methyltetrahydrofolate--homocysteine methyltransferase
MLKGLDDYIEQDILELRSKFSRSLDIIENVLMKGMQEVGDSFAAGKMFLPQVIRSARVMKKAVTVLEPFIEQEKTNDAEVDNKRKKILLATVKGDVHDIGKNIVAVILACNGYQIVDLGVMVPTEVIIETAIKEEVDIIGLSGLISPSLDEMITTAREMEKQGLRIPLLIGGAAASLAFTGLRISPEYSGPVVYVKDASGSVETAQALFSDMDRPYFLEKVEKSYRAAAARHSVIQSHITVIPIEQARENKIPMSAYIPVEPHVKGIIEFQDYPLEQVIYYIDWDNFLYSWDLGKKGSLADNSQREKMDSSKAELLSDAQKLLDRIKRDKLLTLKGVIGFFPAYAQNEDIIVLDTDKQERFCFLRNQQKKPIGGANSCLADFVCPDAATGATTGWIGFFALSAGFGLKEAEPVYTASNDVYSSILLGTLANSLAEAFSEEMHLRVRREFWAYNPQENLSVKNILKGGYTGIRPAFGYPACPDHQDKKIVFRLLEASERIGLEITDSAMIIPAASVCGMYLAHPASYYFSTGVIGEDQLNDWALRKGIGREEALKRMGRI